MIILFFAIIVLIFILFLFHFIYKDRLTELIIKLKMIEEKINSILIKRKDLIKESEVIIKQELNTDKLIYDKLDDTKNVSNIIELDKTLLICVNEFILIKDKYKKLNKNEDFKKIAYSIDDTIDELYSYKNYYNTVAEKYNNLVKKLPILLSSIIRGRKKRKLFDEVSLNEKSF